MVVDEVQFAKMRDEAVSSKRRAQISKLISAAGDADPRLMVLGLSGTPILNNLMEGRKLIEMVFSEVRRDLPTETNRHSAMRMYQEFAEDHLDELAPLHQVVEDRRSA